MSGFWGDLRDAGFDSGESLLKQLAAQKLANEGILRTSSSLTQLAVTAQPQRESVAPLVPPQPVAESDAWGDAGIVVLIVMMILLFRR